MNQQPRRLRSSAVSLGLVGALALSLSGCGTSSGSATRRCIDTNTLRPTDGAYQLASDPSCVGGTAATSGSFGTTPSNRYYYGGVVSNGYVSRGSFTVPTSRTTGSSSRHWYNPTSWRSSSNSNTSGTSSTSSNTGTTQSGVTTGGLGSGSKSGSSGKSSSSSS